MKFIHKINGLENNCEVELFGMDFALKARLSFILHFYWENFDGCS